MAKSMLEDWDSEIENILIFIVTTCIIFCVLVGGILYTHTHTHTCVCVCVTVPHLGIWLTTPLKRDKQVS